MIALFMCLWHKQWDRDGTLRQKVGDIWAIVGNNCSGLARLISIELLRLQQRAPPLTTARPQTERPFGFFELYSTAVFTSSVSKLHDWKMITHPSHLKA